MVSSLKKKKFLSLKDMLKNTELPAMNWESMKIYLQYMQMMQGYHVESIKNSY
jgi:hypothetical protein